MVNLARFRKLDPEVLLASANRKFEERFGRMERMLKADGGSLESATLEEMERAWQASKKS